MRNKNIDLIKGVALIFVILVHSLIYTGFYDRTIVGLNDAFYVFLRSVFISCVPLFIMTTGFLMNKHEPSKKYYKNIIKVIVTYVIVSIIQTIIKSNDLPIKLIIKDIFNFSGANYSWYVKMYFGLFLLIPFLNILFINLKKKEKQSLILTLIVMSSLTAFKGPGINSLVPNWWNLYPLIYYFLGAYLRCYNKLELKWDFKILLVMLMFNTLFNFTNSYNETFIGLELNNYMSIFVITSSYYMFKVLLNIKYSGNKIIEILSKHSLTIYLMSYIFDINVYNKISFINNYFLQMILGSLIVLILSTFISILMDKIIKTVLDKTIHKTYDKIMLK